MKPSPSASLNELIGRMDCRGVNLFSESIVHSDFSSNHPETLEIIPPFPYRRRPYVVDFVNIRSNLFPVQAISGPSVLSERGKIVITGPTPPRLKAMLREVVSITKWRVSSVTRQPSPLISIDLGERLNPILTWSYSVG